MAGRVSAPAVGFPRLARLGTPDRDFAPNPFSYNPKYEALQRKPPSFTMASSGGGGSDPDKLAKVRNMTDHQRVLCFDS